MVVCFELISIHLNSKTMYHKSRVHIFIISEDVVFVRLMEYMFNKYLLNPIICKYYSILELKENIDINPDLIILDDVVAGAASFEVISFFTDEQAIHKYNMFFRRECL